jgi:hypothetical protein
MDSDQCNKPLLLLLFWRKVGGGGGDCLICKNKHSSLASSEGFRSSGCTVSAYLLMSETEEDQ